MNALDGYLGTVTFGALERRREERERQKRIRSLEIEIAHLEAVRDMAIKQLNARRGELVEVRRG